MVREILIACSLQTLKQHKITAHLQWLTIWWKENQGEYLLMGVIDTEIMFKGVWNEKSIQFTLHLLANILNKA